MTLDAARFQELGLFDPNGEGAEDALAVLEYVAGLGATEEELLEAQERGSLGDLALSLVLRPPGELLTFEEGVERAGIDIDDAARMIRALGFPDPRNSGFNMPEQYARHLGEILTGGNAVLGPDATLAIARVLGATTSRLASAIIDAFRTNFEAPQLRDGVTYSEVVKRYGEITKVMLPPFMEALDAVFRDHLVIQAYGSWNWDEEGTTSRDLLVGFVDMVGYSTLSRGISSSDLAHLISRFEDVVGEIVSTRNGKVVKMIGDGAMFVIDDVAGGCALALDLVSRFESDESLPPVHVGLAFGPLVTLHGDYFGDAVNVAARLHDIAPASSVLVDDEVATRCKDDFTFTPRSDLFGATDIEITAHELATSKEAS